MEKVFQRLNVYLKGGQVVSIAFNTEKPETLNPQIEDFLKALGDPAKKESNYLFQGARVAVIRLSDVSAADVVSMIQKEEAEGEKK